MGEISRQKAKKVFRDYVAKFDLNDERIQLKIKHTYRVAELCERIAIDLGISDEDRELAWFIGLLHDFGRFEQLKRYHTFIDAKSVDHGQLGVELLFEEGKIQSFLETRKYDSWIRTAIWYHSVYELPDNLSDKEEMFCKILRDADKIDILRVNVETPVSVIYDTGDKEVCNATVTQDVMDSFLAHETILHSKKKTIVDRFVGHLSLVFGLEYPCSIQIVKEQGYYKKLLCFQSENAITNRQFREISKCMEEYLDKTGK